MPPDILDEIKNLARAIVVAGPIPDAGALGAVLNGSVHVQILQVRLLVGDDDVLVDRLVRDGLDELTLAGATAIAVFVVAWIGQFIGHIYEGHRPSFFTDLVFLLVGPMWTLRKLYTRLGWGT